MAPTNEHLMRWIAGGLWCGIGVGLFLFAYHLQLIGFGIIGGLLLCAIGIGMGLSPRFGDFIARFDKYTGRRDTHKKGGGL
ncbi:MAG: hypothetical protein ACYC26_16455 [Phycisphaerales bacterium]